MKTIKRVSTLQKYLDRERSENKTIGFTPTMGALHEGHLSLAGAAKKENDISVVSIFVNPTQFNQKEDLIKYPRKLEEDKRFIRSQCDYLFAPSVTQVYPKSLNTKVALDISHLVFSMEGPNRPGHFEGVVQVVHRFLQIVQPDHIYMGQKDFQQFSIIAYMLRELDMPTKLRVCKTLRENDGLAMSSRNLRLKPEIRKKASIVHKALRMADENLGKIPVAEIRKKALAMMSIPEFKPEYFEIVDGYSMKEIENPAQHAVIAACAACWAGNVRLIDNMILKGEEELNLVS